MGACSSDENSAKKEAVKNRNVENDGARKATERNEIDVKDDVKEEVRALSIRVRFVFVLFSIAVDICVCPFVRLPFRRPAFVGFSCTKAFELMMSFTSVEVERTEQEWDGWSDSRAGKYS